MDDKARAVGVNGNWGNPVAAYPLFQEEGGGSIPTTALELQLVEISARRACELNRRWHSLLPRTDLGNILCGNMTVCYAAYYEGFYYATAIWSQPIIRSLCDGHTLELRRMAICDVAPKNTASRMLGVMRKLVAKRMPEIHKLVSYLAVDVHAGTMYRAAGWQPVGDIVDARPQRLSGINPKTRATGPLQTESRKQRWERTM